MQTLLDRLLTTILARDRMTNTGISFSVLDLRCSLLIQYFYKLRPNFYDLKIFHRYQGSDYLFMMENNRQKLQTCSEPCQKSGTVFLGHIPLEISDTLILSLLFYQVPKKAFGGVKYVTTDTLKLGFSCRAFTT